MCLVLSHIDLPFLTNAIVDVLSPYTIAAPTVYPYSRRKFLVQTI